MIEPLKVAVNFGLKFAWGLIFKVNGLTFVTPKIWCELYPIMFCSAMPLGALLFLRPARDTLRMCEIEMLIFLVKKKKSVRQEWA